MKEIKWVRVESIRLPHNGVLEILRRKVRGSAPGYRAVLKLRNKNEGTIAVASNAAQCVFRAYYELEPANRWA